MWIAANEQPCERKDREKQCEVPLEQMERSHREFADTEPGGILSKSGTAERKGKLNQIAAKTTCFVSEIP